MEYFTKRCKLEANKIMQTYNVAISKKQLYLYSTHNQKEPWQ